ncbi:TraM recognition domain-containing protein [Metabacillus endolithicus]|uniref:TraM recognition domain-containing protein n=1 Tax=Metabacillus endolithicus TaxID=1535204 RepID=A0ABW5C6J2_9BACI
MNKLKPLLRQIKESPKTPEVVSILLHVTLFVFLYSFLSMLIVVFSLNLHWDKGIAIENFPLGLGYPLYISFYMTPQTAPLWVVGVAALLAFINWILATRVKRFSKSVPRRTFSFCLSWGTLTVVILFYIIREIKLIGYDELVQIHETIDPAHAAYLHRGALEFIGYLLMVTPIVIVGLYASYLYANYKEDANLQEWFRTYRFERGWIGRFGEDKVNRLPDIQLARNAETNAPVILEGESRQTGTLLIGPPGSGKTSIKIKTAYRQDLGHMQRMINEFPKLAKKYGIGSKEFERNMGNHLIGTVIIEPAKDLCDDAYELALEHNIPREFITYLDPSNPDTPGFNAMIGPTAQVVETITSVLEAIAQTNNEFFRQAARAVLKHYVYLLKFYKGNEATIPMLDDMYQDPRMVMDMVESIEKTIPPENVVKEMKQDDVIHWMIVKKIVKWFKNEGLRVQKDRDGTVEKYPRGHEHEGKVVVEDLQFEFTRQTRNLLSDITKNPYLARILLAKNEVDLDRLMSKGGILLVNTDDGNLQDLSDTFGKLVLLCVQNAIFRRSGTENTRPIVSFYADEFYDYMNEKFLKLTGKARKYKFAPLVACQSLTQFGVKFGKEFTESMLGTIRNTIVYGGVSKYDAELLSVYLGKTVVEEIQVRESYTPDNMDNPSFGYSESTVRTEKDLASVDDIMFQEFRYSYIRMVQEKSSKRAIRAEGDFVDTSEADKWKKSLDSEAVNFFMDYWKKEVNVSEALVIPEDDEQEDSASVLKKELLSFDKEQKVVKEEHNRFKHSQHKGQEITEENDEVEDVKEESQQEEKVNYSVGKINSKPVSLNDQEQKDNSIFDDVSKEDLEYLQEKREHQTPSADLKRHTVSFSHAFGQKTKQNDEGSVAVSKKAAPASFTAMMKEQKTSSPLEQVTVVQDEKYEHATQELKSVELGDESMELLKKIMSKKNGN